MAGHKNHVNTLSLYETISKKLLFSGSWDEQVLIWNVLDDKNQLVRRIPMKRQVRSIKVPRFQDRFYTASIKGKIECWNFQNFSNIVKESNFFKIIL